MSKDIHDLHHVTANLRLLAFKLKRTPPGPARDALCRQRKALLKRQAGLLARRSERVV